MVKTLIGLALLFFIVTAISCAPAEDDTIIPGYPYTGKTYSGYLPLAKDGRFLHYVFHPSAKDPQKDPVILWLNGGPGCSSLLGWVMEHGPAILQDNGTMKLNDNSWNKIANIIYLESPVGVGFSYVTSGDIKSDDQESAQENLEAVLAFFKKYPELKANDFHIAGESYAGIYIPTLASYILDYNSAATSENKINLKGIMIGNGVTDWKVDTEPATIDFAWSHGIYSTELRNKFESLCLNQNPGQDCDAVKDEIEASLVGVNIYSIYTDCIPPPESKLRKIKLDNNSAAFSYPYTPWFKLGRNRHNLAGTPPCIDMKAQIDYFNRSDIMKALKVKEGIQWTPCYDSQANYTIDQTRGSLYLYPKLLRSKIKIFIFSGDTDAVVPINGTLKWINNLNLPVLEEWRSWKFNNQVAGYTQTFAGIQFVSIKGVGHTVPMYTPDRSFYFFSKYLSGEAL